MKKILSVLMAVLLIGTIFAACGKTEEKKPEDGKLAVDTIKIGVLHITSKDDKSGYTAAHQAGIVGMMKTLGIKDTQVVIKDNINDSDVAATKQALQELVDAECDVVFATSFNYMQSVEEFAKNNPKMIFSHCSGYLSNGVNFNNYFGRIYEARYLAGIAAGLKAKEVKNPKLGFVAAMDSKNAEVTGGIDAFALGAQSVYPEATVMVKVTGQWFSPDDEGKAAQALIDAGCSVIGQHCDSDVTQTTIAKANAKGIKVYGCGYNSDMTPAAPTTHITAPIWNWEKYYVTAVQTALDGKWKEFGNYYEGMAKDLVDVSPINEAVAAPGTKAAIDAAKAKIKDGSLIVFNTGVEKADGTKLAAPLTDKEITGEINWYVKGVTAN
ncbi:MAG: BMP family ABC transporter substrate-binding protein [Oscillospiraceae bacterium]